MTKPFVKLTRTVTKLIGYVWQTSQPDAPDAHKLPPQTDYRWTAGISAQTGRIAWTREMRIDGGEWQFGYLLSHRNDSTYRWYTDGGNRIGCYRIGPPE